MPEFTSYADGQMCWVALSTTDADQAVEFYSALFGWTTEVYGDPRQGCYAAFLQNGKRVATVSSFANTTEAQPLWHTSIKTSDVDKSVLRCTEAGGTVLVVPTSNGSDGSFAAIEDPAGSRFYLWQPKDMIGAEVATEVNTWVWNILNTPQIQVAKDFYMTAFGWDVAPPLADIGDVPYSEFTLDGIRIAGALKDPEVESFWSTVFLVDDCAHMTAKAEALGATVQIANDKSIIGVSYSVVVDLAGARFTVLQAPEADSRFRR